MIIWRRRQIEKSYIVLYKHGMRYNIYTFTYKVYVVQQESQSYSTVLASLAEVKILLIICNN